MYGLSLDIGTTTCIGSLLDLTTNNELAQYSTWNKQNIYGDNIITRIGYALNKKGLKNLNRKIIETINEIITHLLGKTGLTPPDIKKVAISSNTVMLHFILMKDVKKLATYPFETNIAENREIVTTAEELGINTNNSAKVYFIPIVSAFIGGDVTSLILVTGLDKTKYLQIGIDLGTNGEIVFAKDDTLIATSCACGGCFEGYNLSCGMLAKEGAISKIKVQNAKCKVQNAKCKIEYEVIGGGKPRGLCGSAVFDLIACLLKYNIITSTGRFTNNMKHFFIDKKYNIYLTQADIRNFQLAKAAIYSAILLLKDKLKLKLKEINKIFISGAFGEHLNKESMKIVKLLPDIPNNKIVFAGNTSLEGAKLVLSNAEEYEKAVNITKKVKYINLAEEKDYQEYFINSINFKKN